MLECLILFEELLHSMVQLKLIYPQFFNQESTLVNQGSSIFTHPTFLAAKIILLFHQAFVLS
jgi:hypothetical protein